MLIGRNFNIQSFSAYRIGQNDEQKRQIAQQISNIQDKDVRNQVVDAINTSLEKLNSVTNDVGYIDFRYIEPKDGQRGRLGIQIKRQWQNGYFGLAYADKFLIAENDSNAISTKDIPSRIKHAISVYTQLVQQRTKLTSKEQEDIEKIISALA